jgi:hypothetical protein
MFLCDWLKRMFACQNVHTTLPEERSNIFLRLTDRAANLTSSSNDRDFNWRRADLSDRSLVFEEYRTIKISSVVESFGS